MGSQRRKDVLRKRHITLLRCSNQSCPLNCLIKKFFVTLKEKVPVIFKHLITHPSESYMTFNIASRPQIIPPWVSYIKRPNAKNLQDHCKQIGTWPILTRFHGIWGVGRCIPPACCRCSCIIYFTPPGTGFIWLTPGGRTVIWSRWSAFAPDCTKEREF